MAAAKRVAIEKQAKIRFQIEQHTFQDSFLIMPTMNSIILGNPFFNKHNITIDPKNNLLHLPELTVQFNQILPEQAEKPRFAKTLPKLSLLLTKKVHIPPQSQALLECQLDNDEYTKLYWTCYTSISYQL